MIFIWHPIDCCPWLNKKKGSWALPFISLCFLAMDTMQPAASSSYCLDFSTMADCALKLKPQKSLFPSLLCMCQGFCHNHEKKWLIQGQWENIKKTINTWKVVCLNQLPLQLNPTIRSHVSHIPLLLKLSKLSDVPGSRVMWPGVQLLSSVSWRCLSNVFW